ncbi:tRNA-dihydrouridinen 47 synthase NADP+ [Ceratocystis lukuohia]|uniref:tRNA-dihydrouridine(47) synthase [NAD(P)(+)] n=1 Tax=Ceratocystis lukuohia TaxID=2019550 RepID=A0ABR4MBZ0_9PEZI
MDASDPKAVEIVEPTAKRIRTDAPSNTDEVATFAPTPVPVSTSGSADAAVSEAPRAQDKPTSTQDSTHVNGRRQDQRDSGVAPIKAEYLLTGADASRVAASAIDYDLAEGREETGGGGDNRSNNNKKGKDKRKKQTGQNNDRFFGATGDANPLCNTRVFNSEFSPRECPFGESCKRVHDLRKYLQEDRRPDLESFGGLCPVFDTYGECTSGWKCRFVKSHSKEITHEDGRKELILLKKNIDGTIGPANASNNHETEGVQPGLVNIVSSKDKIDLARRRVDMDDIEKYVKWIDNEGRLNNEYQNRRKREDEAEVQKDMSAQYVEPPMLPSEKRRLYFAAETPVVAPLTTQGNMPFRRLAVELGAEFTYSEMALSRPLVQGVKSDWALMRAHETEAAPPRVNPNYKNIVFDYDNSRDMRFGAQISGNAPWQVIKAAFALNRFCDRLRVIDLNCGCPVDSQYQTGCGAALLEAPAKIERMVRGMNAVSGEIPITAKIRTGVKSNRPVAPQVLTRLAFGGAEHRERLGAPGCAAVTLHGRSREQRYLKRADWGYIAECGAIVEDYNAQVGALQDTIREPDERTLANSKGGRLFFLGNGDCYSHEEYFDHVNNGKVDSVMIGRGALIKPWLFEEIRTGQYLDKSATERLGYIEKFVKYGLDAWGSDEHGVNYTRRFLLEWLSFTQRYIPVGILERLPPSLNDRPPPFKGRNELETLLASGDSRDWIKISEMFLGPAPETFRFVPKHKSHAYEVQG